VVSGSTYSVTPFNQSTLIYPYGEIVVDVSQSGFVTTNITTNTHIFYDGLVIRTLYQTPSGSWVVTTHGYGNNIQPRYAELDNVWADVNQDAGPGLFNGLDQAMADNITQHH